MIKSTKYILFILSLMSYLGAFSQSTIVFSEKGLTQALALGKKENKPVLLFCYASWCPHCKFMRENVFCKPEVASFFNNTFICLEQDMEKGEGIELNKEIKISSFPTFIMYDPNGLMVYRIEGEFKPQAFIQEGKNALTNKMQLPYQKQKFEKDVSNSNNCYEYIRALKKGGMDCSQVVNQYFATQNEQQLLSEVNWRIISNGVSDINCREMQFVINHQKEFAWIASPLRVKRKLDYMVKELLNPFVDASDTANYRINRKSAAQIHSFSTDSLIFYFDLRIAGLTKNWSLYRQTSLQFTDTFAGNNHTQLAEIAGNFLKNIQDTKALSAAEHWARKSLAFDEEYDTYLLCSSLYQKLKNIPEAISMAERAKELSTKFGWEGKEAEKLLRELNLQKH